MNNVKNNSKHSNNKIAIVSIICGTLLVFAVIGACFYINQQNLIQQRELKEKEIKAANDRSEKQIRSDNLEACLSNAGVSSELNEENRFSSSSNERSERLEKDECYEKYK